VLGHIYKPEFICMLGAGVD